MDDITAKLSARGQMTVPKAARQALGITGGGELVFRVNNGRAMVARTKRLLDTAAAPADERTATPRLPWDAGRRTRLAMRSKPRRTPVGRTPASPEPGTELTVDLRPEDDPSISPAGSGSESDDLTP